MRQRDDQCASNHREKSYGKFALADQGYPEMEKKIIQRGVNILRRAVDDRVETARRECNAGALVIPQTLRAEQMHAEEERDEQRDKEPETVFVFEEELNQRGNLFCEDK